MRALCERAHWFDRSLAIGEVMTHQNLCASLIMGLLLSACAGAEPDGGRSLPPAATVAMSLPDRPGVTFVGFAAIEVSTIPYTGPGESAHISMGGGSADSGEQVSMHLYVPLDVLHEALQGRVGVVPLAIPGWVSSNVYSGPTVDFRTAGENVQSFTLALDGATITLTATVPSGTITAYGQFAVGCTQDNGLGIMTDGRWESEFCARSRDTLGLAPWIAASR